MSSFNKVKSLTAAIALLTGAQSAQALTPWTHGPAEVVIYTSGGAAQDRALEEAVRFGLAAPGSIDVFEDSLPDGTRIGNRFNGWYFTGANALTNGLAGKRIYIAKRNLGAAGYGVVPLAGNIGLDQLDIFLTSSNGTLGSSQAGAWVANGAGHWRPVAGITNTAGNTGQSAWSNYLVQNQLSDAGFTGVDGAALLAPGTNNYPEATREPSTNANTSPWPNDLTVANLQANGVTRVPTGGLVYGVGVPLSFYRVLQVAQARSGQLPADTLSQIGKYDDERYLPSLSREFVASLLSGRIRDWRDVRFVDRSDNDGNPNNDPIRSLADPTVAAAAGVTVPSLTKVAIGRRNRGAAIGAVPYAKFLGYPYDVGGAAPAAATINTAAVDNGTTAPIAKSPGGANATDSLLIDWENGTNTSGFNPAARRFWGIAIHGGDRNASLAQPWRYVRINGAAPTIANVANGSYPIWGEGEVLIRPASAIGADKVALLNAFARALNNVAVAQNVNTNAVLPFGQSGVFATTATDPTASIRIPFDPTNPVVALSHRTATGLTSVGVVPTPFNNGLANPNFGNTTNSILELK